MSSMKSSRLEKAENLLGLARDMQNSHRGISLAEIMAEYEVSRRTAERMRDSVLRIYPDVVEDRDRDGLKRWKILSVPLRFEDPIQSGELAALATAVELLRQEGREDQALRLEALEAKIRSATPRATLNRIEPDYELLTQSESFACRPGPHPEVSAEVLGSLRTAILSYRQVGIAYRSRGTGILAHRIVAPYGFLYGTRPYLVARCEDGEVPGFRLLSLANIETAEMLPTPFVRDEGFSLADYAAQSFGVFQEDPVDVVWRVLPGAAKEARTWRFHPHQKIDEQPDGSLIVSFRAGGLLEMCWHLFTWSGEIEVLAPESLKRMMAHKLAQCSMAYSGSSSGTAF
jgi:predicted DNA-binding transcriptional regulator YafY